MIYKVADYKVADYKVADYKVVDSKATTFYNIGLRTIELPTKAAAVSMPVETDPLQEKLPLQGDLVDGPGQDHRLLPRAENCFVIVVMQLDN